jgi:hypothetical protein
MATTKDSASAHPVVPEEAHERGTCSGYGTTTKTLPAPTWGMVTEGRCTACRATLASSSQTRNGPAWRGWSADRPPPYSPFSRRPGGRHGP